MGDTSGDGECFEWEFSCVSGGDAGAIRHFDADRSCADTKIVNRRVGIQVMAGGSGVKDGDWVGGL